MKKYAQIIDKETKAVNVGVGTNTDFYKSIGMELLDVEQSEVDGQWYLANKCPHYSDDEKFNNAKAEKLRELEQKSSAFEQTENKEMYIVSSLGFKVNADPKALRNIDVLISQKVTQFKVYDNTLKPVTVDELKIIKSEIEQNALNLYHQKWDFEDRVNNADSIEELEKIDIDFKMLDFSAIAEVADEVPA